MERVFQELKVHRVTFRQIHGIEKSICFLSDNSLLKKNGKKIVSLLGEETRPACLHIHVDQRHLKRFKWVRPAKNIILCVWQVNRSSFVQVFLSDKTINRHLG